MGIHREQRLGAAVLIGPKHHFAQTAPQSAPQILTQRHGPKSEGGVTVYPIGPGRCRQSNRNPRHLPSIRQTCLKIRREKRRVCRHGQDMLCALVGRPIHSGQDPRQRPWKFRHRIGNHRQIKRFKTCRIAIGTQRHVSHLRAQSLQNMINHPSSGQRA